MNKEVAAAIWEWFASLIIGVMPLLMHAVLHLLAKPAANWEDSWAGDMFVTISNSGLSVVTVFARAQKKLIGAGRGSSNVNMAASLALFVVAGALYGLVATGHSSDHTIFAAIIILLGSAFTSLYFEIILAGVQQPPG
jgi:hypothetical protein